MKEEYYKKDEIEEHFFNFLAEAPTEWIEENIDDIHHHAFNEDYYIIGTYQAKKWCGDEVFNIIEIIREYEESNFGEVTTDFSDSEKVVNMYTYIVGEQVVSEWLHEKQEEEIKKALINKAESQGANKEVLEKKLEVMIL